LKHPSDGEAISAEEMLDALLMQHQHVNSMKSTLLFHRNMQLQRT
jgi:hypothetical protein